MQYKLTLALIVASSFLAGFVVRGVQDSNQSQTRPRVSGIGGIFFKCRDPKAIREWYAKNLGLETNAYGSVFEWHQGVDSTKKGFTQWSPFKESTKYFEPSNKDFMINYRVENLTALLAELKTNGVKVVDSVQSVDYGSFVHIMDPEGNKLELWQANDVEYENMGLKMGLKTTK